jgi:hypothetical protein
MVLTILPRKCNRPRAGQNHPSRLGHSRLHTGILDAEALNVLDDAPGSGEAALLAQGTPDIPRMKETMLRHGLVPAPAS